MPEYRRLRAVAAGSVLVMLVGLFSVDYRVERGDTLGKIAKEHGVSVTDLVEANDIENPDLIRIGQVLVIPGEQGKSDVVHVVVRGDTLGRIAREYGSTVSDLVKANGIANPNLIRLGQRVVVPGQSAVEAGASSDAESEGTIEGGNAAVGTGTFTRSGRHHIVKSGEKLEAIAAQYSGVSSDQIANANGIVNGVVYTNTRLFLDGPAHVAEGTEGEMVYQIRSGDRLGDIAAVHGIKITELVDANGIDNPNLIRAGQDLVVPTGSRWVCPVEDARFFNDWGFPRAGGSRYHEGNDLFADFGTPVYAPVSGRVEFKTGALGGMQFNLSGDDGVEYIGSHMSEFGKSGRVRAGDVVGRIGTTGNAQGTSPHLHFGMYLEGGLVINPYPTLIAHGCK